MQDIIKGLISSYLANWV